MTKVSGSPGTLPRRVGGEDPERFIWGTYTGEGTGSFNRSVSLPRAVVVLFVTGTPTGGLVHQEHVILGGPDAIKFEATQTPTTGQLRLAADGRSFSVDGTGTGGLDENGTQYWYFGVTK